MVKPSKIRKHNLEEETYQLKDMKYSNQEIAKLLKENHPDIKDISNLSGMSVGRFFRSEAQQDIEVSVKEGGDPIKDFVEEYREAIEDINRKTNELYDKTMKILDDIESKSNSDALRLKAVKEARDSLEQMRKNKVSLIQYGERRSGDIYNVNLKKEYYVKNMLLHVSRNLCPKCRAEFPKLILELEDEEEEEKKEKIIYAKEKD